LVPGKKKNNQLYTKRSYNCREKGGCAMGSIREKISGNLGGGGGIAKGEKKRDPRYTLREKLEEEKQGTRMVLKGGGGKMLSFRSGKNRVIKVRGRRNEVVCNRGVNAIVGAEKRAKGG